MRIFSILLCSFFAHSYSQNGLEPGMELKWGESLNHVKNVLSDKSLQFNSITRDVKTNSLIFIGGRFNEYDVDNWAFGFYEDQFYTYTINLEQMFQAKDHYQKLIDQFTSLFGTAEIDKEHVRDHRIFKTHQWYIKRSGKEDDILELSTWQYNGVHISIHFYYGELTTIVNAELKKLGM